MPVVFFYLGVLVIYKKNISQAMIFIFLYGEILSVIGLLIGILIMVAYFTLLERKAMANMQRRYGPNYVGLFGILQPLADGLKLLRKMYSHVYSANL